MQKLMPKDKLKITEDGIEYEFEVAAADGVSSGREGRVPHKKSRSVPTRSKQE